MDAHFDLFETSSQKVTCEVAYTGGKEVYVAFDQERITSHEKLRFPMSAARRFQIDRLVKWTRAYLQERLPGYYITVSASLYETCPALQQVEAACRPLVISVLCS